MSQRRLETFPDLPRPLGTPKRRYTKGYCFVKQSDFHDFKVRNSGRRFKVGPSIFLA